MRQARRFRLEGRVQGRGLRPAIARLARVLELAGEVANVGGRVEGVIEGEGEVLVAFFSRLPGALPGVGLWAEPVAATGRAGFRILESLPGGCDTAFVPLDLPLCPACLGELRNPSSRRHRHPFIACAECGPRYSLLADLPWDRARTGMAAFTLCAACQREFDDPNERRFHAEAMACPDCGPRLGFVDGRGRVDGDAVALAAAAALLRAGGILALKGVGGYQLMCDARSEAAVRRLRERKRRPGKPLAVMYPWSGADGLERVRWDFELDRAEEEALTSNVRPIVLLRPRAVERLLEKPSCTNGWPPSPPRGEGWGEGRGALAPYLEAGLAEGIAPGLAEIGVMLPSSPLHHVLLDDFGGPLVATSGNRSGEPLVWDEAAAEARLAGIADAFLHHDRPILRPVDDPLRRVIAGRARPLRLGRGDAPLELDVPFAFASPRLAVGGQMKNAVALGWGRRAVLSPHVGELDSPRALERFAAMIEGLQALYGVRAERIVHDQHPGYAASRWAQSQPLPCLAVQHHAAHAAALYAELWQAQGAEPGEMLVLAWDGLGLGEDGSLRGGEALLGRPGRWRRVASLRPFPLPGGERAAREPWRSALGMAWATGLEVAGLAPSGGEVGLLRQALARGLNTPATSSMGRLFDGAAALLDLCREASHEGEAAMHLEAAAVHACPVPGLPLVWQDDAEGLLRLDWTPLVPLLRDASLPVAERARAFHASLAKAALDLARRLAAPMLGVTGGVMQNRLLVELIHAGAAAEGVEVVFPSRVPVNDAGLAFGQLVEAHFTEHEA
ncbi:MAG: carbamoyltransferase HypF [Pseudomonadota bacterium]